MVIGMVCKRLFIAVILSLLLLVSVGVIRQIIVAAASQPKTLDRNLEPVIVKGNSVDALSGAPVGHLFVYTYNGISLGGQIPAQVDEITMSGHYTAIEDGLLDANDEIVFMAKDLGDRAPNPASLTTTLPISAAWYEIEVTDPLSPTKKGWAYLVRSSSLPISFSSDYVNYLTATQRVTTNRYEAGFTNAYAGLDYFNLNGSGDILDRTKLRVVINFFGIPWPFTEDDLSNDDVETILIKDGPVRVILMQLVTASPTPPIAEGSVRITNLAYASLLQSTASVSFTFPISGVRTSVDFNNTITGATFYNASISGGVAIDGRPDAVPVTPLSNWGQVSTTTGRLVQVANPASATPAGGSQKNYYCDDNDPNPGALECDGTPKSGDNVAYGDTGLLIEGGINPAFTLDSALYVLAPAASGPNNVGTTYANYFFNPLLVGASFQAANPIGPNFLPIILKNR
jgi:hypothetical protein